HVAVQNVGKTYGNGGDAVESIRSVSFDLAHGAFLSIVGPSGCGKSTLLMMVAGLLPITAGAIVVDGRPVTGPRREHSVMFQTPTLFPWRTVLENVLFPIEVLKGDLEAHRAEALKLLEMAGL